MFPELTKILVDIDEELRHYVPMAVKAFRPTEGELNILQVLWQAGPNSVREIQRILNQSKPTGYTTA